MGGFRNFGMERHTYFLSINGKGNLYESSAEPKGGFVQHFNEMNGQPSGYWREYPGGFQAYLNYIGLKASTNSNGIPVTSFIMTFRDYSSDDDFCVRIPLKTQKGGIHRYVKSFVKYYKNIDISRELVFNAFKRRPEDQYSPSNLFFAYPVDGGKDEMIPLYFKNGQNGWVEGKKMKSYDGNEYMDFKDQDAFVYNKLNEYITDFNSRIKEIRASLSAKYSGNNKESQSQPAPRQYTQGGGVQQPDAYAQQPQQPSPVQPSNVSHVRQQPPVQPQAQPVPQAPQSYQGVQPATYQNVQQAPYQNAQQAPQGFNTQGPVPQAPQARPEVVSSGFRDNSAQSVTLPEYEDDLPF